MPDVEVRGAVVQLRVPGVDEEPAVAAGPVVAERAAAFDVRSHVLRFRQGVIEVELEPLRIALAQREHHRVVVGPPDGAERRQRVVLFREVSELAELAARRIAELVHQPQGRDVVGAVDVVAARDGRRRAGRRRRRVGEEIFPVRDRREARVGAERCVRRNAGRLGRANQLLRRGEVVGVRRGIDEVQRHREVAAHQQIAAEASDVPGLEREVAAQLAPDDEADRVRRGGHQRIVDAGGDDAGAYRRRLRESAGRGRRQGRRQRRRVDESRLGDRFIGQAERAADARRHPEGEPLIEVERDALADAVEHLRVAAAHDELVLAGQPAEEAARGMRRPRD